MRLVVLDVLTGTAIMALLAIIDYFAVVPLKLYKTGLLPSLLFRTGEWVPLMSVVLLGHICRKRISFALLFFVVFACSDIYSELTLGIAYAFREQGIGVILGWLIAYVIGCMILAVLNFWRSKWHTNWK